MVVLICKDNTPDNYDADGNKPDEYAKVFR